MVNVGVITTIYDIYMKSYGNDLIFEDFGVPTSSFQWENTSLSGPLARFPSHYRVVVRLKISNNTYGWSTYPLLVKPLVYLNKTGY